MKCLDLLRPHIAAIRARAPALDETATFPTEDMALLRELGLPATPLPRALGGEGAGTEPHAATTTFELLRALGQANPSLGRLFEAHVNAIRLAIRYGTPAQHQTLATDCEAGHFYGLWVTDAPGKPLTLDGTTLKGAKGPGSGAGHLERALVTVTAHGETRMALITLTGQEHVDPLSPRLQGMRAAANGTITLDGTPLPPGAILGYPGDYLREPDFSTGAWRTMAVTLGALETLVDAVRDQLRARHHDDAPLQQARFGQMLIAQETAHLWTAKAAEIAERANLPIPDQVAYINLARIAVESASLEAMQHAQRALGLAAFLRPNPIERLCRDLATYLRQPAPDAVLTEAAHHHLARP